MCHVIYSTILSREVLSKTIFKKFNNFKIALFFPLDSIQRYKLTRGLLILKQIIQHNIVFTFQ